MAAVTPAIPVETAVWRALAVAQATRSATAYAFASLHVHLVAREAFGRADNCRRPSYEASMGSMTSLAVISAACFAAALIGGKVTAPQIPTWYARLRKPNWTPPPLAFPIVWPILYILIAIAGWLLWESLPSERRTLPLAAFFVQLALNAAWSPVFFGAHRLFAGLIVIILLDAAIIVTIGAAWPVEKWTSLLLLPYLAWTAFATALNARIWKLNRSA